MIVSSNKVSDLKRIRNELEDKKQKQQNARKPPRMDRTRLKKKPDPPVESFSSISTQNKKPQAPQIEEYNSRNLEGIYPNYRSIISSESSLNNQI